MESSTILICYDGSPEAQRAIEAAGSLVHAGRAIVLDVGPLLTTAESYSLFTPPGPERSSRSGTPLPRSSVPRRARSTREARDSQPKHEPASRRRPGKGLSKRLTRLALP